MSHPVFELRQYLLHPAMRETLIELFDREFLETQEACRMEVVGQFRENERPDHFVWIRGFRSVEGRAPALQAFYDGPVWRQHREAANATMVDSDNVLMLRPAWDGATVGLLEMTRPPISERPRASEIEITVLSVERNQTPAFVARFVDIYQPLLADMRICFLGAMVSDHRPNDFPRLPVRENANVFVWITRAEGPDGGELANTSGPLRDAYESLAELSAGEAQRMRLLPTARSRLR